MSDLDRAQRACEILDVVSGPVLKDGVWKVNWESPVMRALSEVQQETGLDPFGILVRSRRFDMLKPHLRERVAPILERHALALIGAD